MIRFYTTDGSQKAAFGGVDPARLRYLKGQRLVAKLGGEVAADPAALGELVHNFCLLRELGVRVLVCHGGGPQISAALKAGGIEPQFREGLRVTDEKSFEIVAQVLLGDINRRLVAALEMAGVPAVGLSGIDGRFIKVRPKDERLGLVGEITAVNPVIIGVLWQAGYFPVVAPLGIDSSGQAYNINADAVAAEAAKAVQAGRLILLTGVPGIYSESKGAGPLIAEIDPAGLRELSRTPAISGGMVPKVGAALSAVEGGVPLVQICSGRGASALLRALDPECFGGTVVRAAVSA